MSDTPKTDALYFPRGRDSTTMYVPHISHTLAHSEQLERECASLTARLEEAEKEARRKAFEECAKVVERRAERRWEENGHTEPDTNASYYTGSEKEWNTAQDEEDEACAIAIRALAPKPDTGKAG